MKRLRDTPRVPGVPAYTSARACTVHTRATARPGWRRISYRYLAGGRLPRRFLAIRDEVRSRRSTAWWPRVAASQNGDDLFTDIFRPVSARSSVKSRGAAGARRDADTSTPPSNLVIDRREPTRTTLGSGIPDAVKTRSRDKRALLGRFSEEAGPDPRVYTVPGSASVDTRGARYIRGSRDEEDSSPMSCATTAATRRDEHSPAHRRRLGDTIPSIQSSELEKKLGQ
ncbi:hypothetical protein DBV15_01359 [Temnothorax longispinosus]|uniref:Uncharacterized protein n=1 Tax=Temnothorax longispinosus TaxID=300112 RepID=A0A4S2KZ67_9HYME|nr:hypothetical protein DBV15_01359 [Temnothorax longispinosus]